MNGASVGKTPYTGPIPRGSETTLSLAKEGYVDKSITLYTQVEPIFFGNIIFGGSFGSSTDYGTGAMYRYAPSTFDVELERLSPSAYEEKPPETAEPVSTPHG